MRPLSILHKHRTNKLTLIRQLALVYTAQVWTSQGSCGFLCSCFAFWIICLRQQTDTAFCTANGSSTPGTFCYSCNTTITKLLSQTSCWRSYDANTHPTGWTPCTSIKKKKVTRQGKKKGGVKARLKRGESKHCALPSVILTNVRSLCNKTDELQANVFHMYEYWTASILAFTETWLNGNDNSDSLHVDGFGSPVRLD